MARFALLLIALIFGIVLIVIGLQRPDTEKVGGEVPSADLPASEVDETLQQPQDEPADTGQTTILWIGIVVSIGAVAGSVWLLRRLLPKEQSDMPPIAPHHRKEASEEDKNGPPPRP